MTTVNGSVVARGSEQEEDGKGEAEMAFSLIVVWYNRG